MVGLSRTVAGVDLRRQLAETAMKYASMEINPEARRIAAYFRPEDQYILRDLSIPEILSIAQAAKKKADPGRPAEPETALVIEAEAQRLFRKQTGKVGESKYVVSRRFWAQLTPEERYANYRTRVRDNAKKIQTRLSELKG